MTLTAISRQRHADKRWKRNSSYSFAAKETVAPLVIQELPRAVLSLPTGFVKKDDGYELVAVLGLGSDTNLMVAPDGTWVRGYIPAVYRTYPFALATSKEGDGVLCIREESGLIGEADGEGEAFFDEQGEPTKTIKDALAFLEQLAGHREQTRHVIGLLAEHGVIQPWKIQFKVGEKEAPLTGLYRVDEKILNELPADAFEALRKGGALSMVYCQLLSMQHMSGLAELFKQRLVANAQTSEGSTKATAPSAPDAGGFFNEAGNIKFQ